MIEQAYLESVVKRFKEYKALGDKTLVQLNEAQLSWQPNASSNSIAMIIQHMHGNMLSRWTNFLTEDGEKAWRKRDTEFEAQTQTKENILALWEAGWKALLDTLADLNDPDLLRTITIRSEPLIAIDAINRQLAHYSSHVGQIVYIGKWQLQDQWQSLSIARGDSQAFNEKMKTEHGERQ